MRTIGRLGVLFATCGATCVGLADGPFAGVADGAVNELATDAVQDGAMSLSAEGEAYKTGAGAWSLPWGALGSWELQKIIVKNGSLLLDLDDTTERAAECPRDVLNAKALFWFDASFLADHPGLYSAVESDGKKFLSYMYDVRENFAGGARQRPYAAANHYLRVVKAGLADGSAANVEMKWDADKMPSPELVTRNDKTAIWFGGVGSGRSMSIYRKDGSVSTIADVVHVFAVTDSPEGWGAVFSPGFRPTGVWTGTPEYSWGVPILHTDECNRYTGNRTYFNGVRKDGQKDVPVKGFTLFECELFNTPVSVNRLFYAESGAPASNKIVDEETRAVNVQYGGGDYLYEVICFTNRLTGAERQRVVSYLQRKWFPDAAKTASLTGAEGTTIAVSNATESDAVVTRDSAANLVKNGAGDLWFRRDANNLAEQRGAVTLGEDAGRVLAQRPVAFAVEPGRRYTAEAGDEAVAISATARTDGASTRVVKDGNAELMIRGVPETVKEIEVADGTLVVRPRGNSSRGDGLDTANDDVYIPIPNASFEERASGDENAPVIAYKSGTPYCGWVSLDGTLGNCQVIYNVDKWPLDEKNGIMDGVTRQGWGLTAVPHGGSSLFLRVNAGVRTAEPLNLSAGRYQIDFWTNGRGNDNGGIVDIVLVDSETMEETVVGRQWQIYTAAEGFGRVAYRFTLPEERRCYLGFRVKNYGTENMIAQMAIDDISLRRVAKRSDITEWAIPGGDFEAVVAADYQTWASRVFTSAITHSDWTLTQPTGADSTDYNLGCGFANRYMYKYGVHEVPCYNNSRAPFQSTILTFMVNGATASTTFTPPKGTWYLKGDIAMNGPHSTCTLSAKATINGAEYDLGTLKPQNKIFATSRFGGGQIVSDGVTPVTLTFTYGYPGTTYNTLNHPAVYVDDLMLTKVLDDAVLVHGEPVFRHTFEDTTHTDWTYVQTPDNGFGYTLSYASLASSHSAKGETLGGQNGCYIRHDGGVILHRDFEKAGTYRLSLFMNRRADQPGTNPVHVWIAQNGVTNELAVLRAGTAWRTERSVVFRIPEGESYEYDIGFMGTYPGKNWNAKDEYIKNCSDTIIDDLTVVRVGDEELVRTETLFAKDTDIYVGEHGRLQLDFDGTNRVNCVKFRNHTITGVISAQTHPEFVSGQGALLTFPRGTTILVR